jgi:hypothetical protein
VNFTELEQNTAWMANPLPLLPLDESEIWQDFFDYVCEKCTNFTNQLLTNQFANKF